MVAQRLLYIRKANNMSYSPIASFVFSSFSESGLDANSTSTVTDAFDISNNNFVAWQVLANTGVHNTHIIKLQGSIDKINWATTSSSITGIGINDNVQITARYIRFKVTTAEGATSTVNILAHSK